MLPEGFIGLTIAALTDSPPASKIIFASTHFVPGEHEFISKYIDLYFTASRNARQALAAEVRSYQPNNPIDVSKNID